MIESVPIDLYMRGNSVRCKACRNRASFCAIHVH